MLFTHKGRVRKGTRVGGDPRSRVGRILKTNEKSGQAYRSTHLDFVNGAARVRFLPLNMNSFSFARLSDPLLPVF